MKGEGYGEWCIAYKLKGKKFVEIKGYHDEIDFVERCYITVGKKETDISKKEYTRQIQKVKKQAYKFKNTSKKGFLKLMKKKYN